MVTYLGKGAILLSSSKQKINTRSSTESEIVAVDGGITKPLWMRNLLLVQGEKVEDCILFQDNQSSIRLKYGFASAGKRSKHFDIRFWFITDRVKSGVISSIEFCPTLNMLVDVMTKPLQGSLFQKFRNNVLGICVDRVHVGEYNRRAREFLN